MPLMRIILGVRGCYRSIFIAAMIADMISWLLLLTGEGGPMAVKVVIVAYIWLLEL